MKITELLIDRFGVWNDITMPLSDAGVSVFYGPNEAGKSTLMRFIRGVLYGFPPQTEQTPGPQPRTLAGQGGLRIRLDGQEHLLRRESQSGNRGRLRLDKLDWGTPSQQKLSPMLSGITESLYERIFAIGLSELQELATLDGEDVAQQIFGISLGPEGQRILQAREALDQQRTQLVRDDRKAGELVTLARRLEALDRQLAGMNGSSRRHRELRDEQDRLTVRTSTTVSDGSTDCARSCADISTCSGCMDPGSASGNSGANARPSPSSRAFPTMDSIACCASKENFRSCSSRRRRHLPSRGRRANRPIVSLPTSLSKNCGVTFRPSPVSGKRWDCEGSGSPTSNGRPTSCGSRPTPR